MLFENNDFHDWFLYICVCMLLSSCLIFSMQNFVFTKSQRVDQQITKHINVQLSIVSEKNCLCMIYSVSNVKI